MKAFWLAALLGSTAVLAAGSTADFYFVDVAQGNATLIVSPSGQTMLLDAGLPRFADKVFEATERAGVKKIDYMVATHFHDDHFGGIEPLAAKIPMVNFVDHGPSVEYQQSEEWWKKLKEKAYRDGMPQRYDEMYAGYLKTIGKGNHIVVKAGDRIPVKGLVVTVVTAGGKAIAKPLPGGGAPTPACADFEKRLDDY